MKKLTLAVTLMLTPVLAQAWPWSHDMANQISVKPQAPVPSQSGPELFPSRSVPVPGTTVFVKDMDTALKMTNPVAANEKSVQRGHYLYDIYCAACHGKSGTGDGLVGAKLLLRPFDLTTESLAQQPDGHIFGMITFGGAIMPGYANDLSFSERWDVVNYIRKGLVNAPTAQAASTAK